MGATYSVGELSTSIAVAAAGSTLIHSAACIWSDICDVEFDKQVGTCCDIYVMRALCIDAQYRADENPASCVEESVRLWGLRTANRHDQCFHQHVQALELQCVCNTSLVSCQTILFDTVTLKDTTRRCVAISSEFVLSIHEAMDLMASIVVRYGETLHPILGHI